MKILWFTNSPALSEEFLSKTSIVGKGWIKSLDRKMQEKVDLHIAFYYKKKVSSFKYGNTHYYPIYQGKKSLLGKYIDSKLSRIAYRDDVDKYLDIINKVKPDLIHIHGTENPFGYILEKIDIPVVISIQGNITVYYHKYLSGLEKRYLPESEGLFEKLVGYKPFKVKFKKFNRMKRREAEVLSLCKNIIGRTAWDRRISYMLSPTSCYYHNDEILRDNFYCNKWQNNSHNKFIINTTNSNIYYKGLETICHAASLLIEIGFDNFEWRIAGISNNDLIVKVVKKKLKSLYPKSNLVFMGKLSEKALINKLLESDLYVMSSHIENSPNNLCEAMILGLPCIATYAGGTGSLLNDGVEGILIQDGDPWAMSGAIIECFNNPEKCVEFSRNARIRALKRHDKDIISDDLLNIYNKIIQKSMSNEDRY